MRQRGSHFQHSSAQLFSSAARRHAGQWRLALRWSRTADQYLGHEKWCVVWRPPHHCPLHWTGHTGRWWAGIYNDAAQEPVRPVRGRITGGLIQLRSTAFEFAMPQTMHRPSSCEQAIATSWLKKTMASTTSRTVNIRAAAPTAANPCVARARSRSSRYSIALRRVMSREFGRCAYSAALSPNRPPASNRIAPNQFCVSAAAIAPAKRVLTSTTFVDETGER